MAATYGEQPQGVNRRSFLKLAGFTGGALLAGKMGLGLLDTEANPTAVITTSEGEGATDATTTTTVVEGFTSEALAHVETHFHDFEAIDTVVFTDAASLYIEGKAQQEGLDLGSYAGLDAVAMKYYDHLAAAGNGEPAITQHATAYYNELVTLRNDANNDFASYEMSLAAIMGSSLARLNQIDTIAAETILNNMSIELGAEFEEDFNNHVESGAEAKVASRLHMYNVIAEELSQGKGPKCINFGGNSGKRLAFLFDLGEQGFQALSGRTYRYIVWIYNHHLPGYSTPMSLKNPSRLRAKLKKVDSNQPNQACLGDAADALCKCIELATGVKICPPGGGPPAATG